MDARGSVGRGARFFDTRCDDVADGVHARPDELVKVLDRPWCRADLFYIEKSSAILRALDGARR